MGEEVAMRSVRPGVVVSALFLGFLLSAAIGSCTSSGGKSHGSSGADCDIACMQDYFRGFADCYRPLLDCIEECIEGGGVVEEGDCDHCYTMDYLSCFGQVEQELCDCGRRCDSCIEEWCECEDSCQQEDDQCLDGCRDDFAECAAWFDEECLVGCLEEFIESQDFTSCIFGADGADYELCRSILDDYEQCCLNCF